MKVRKIAVLVLSLATMLSAALPAYAAWNRNKDGSMFYTNDSDGSIPKNAWIQDGENSWKAVDKDGILIVNDWIVSFDGNRYFVNEDGEMLAGKSWMTPGVTSYYDMNQQVYVVENIGAATCLFDASGLVVSSLPFAGANTVAVK